MFLHEKGILIISLLADFRHWWISLIEKYFKNIGKSAIKI